MPLDFSRFTAASAADTATSPRDIFAALPGKSGKYSYLRDVQAEVLAQWHDRRNSNDLRLKMNTGGGKTLVGLLILKSCLNENQGPAAYIAPTPYLVSQVVAEAAALGIAVDIDPRSPNVVRGKSILITSIKTLFNGRSKFGVGGNPDIPIGSVVLDDAHSCLAAAEQQFTLQVDAKHTVYKELLELFRGDFEGQSSSTLLEIEESDTSKLLVAPFWAWHDKLDRVQKILLDQREDDALLFWWPLAAESLRECRCVIGSRRMEIAPRCLPVDMIPSFVRARRRIFMSATFADDGILVTDFDANPDQIKDAIAPTSASDIGDRMILVPQAVDASITDEEIRSLAAERAKSINVAVFVPSHRRATEFWGGVAQAVLKADTLEDGVAALKKGHVGLVVIVNKYDGIDLPDDACRLLVIDGIPDARRDIDRVEELYVQDTWVEAGKSIQQIEQGMGRAVRATDDYCAVLLMGSSLTAHLYRYNGIARFTPATRVQFELAEQLAEQLEGGGISGISDALDGFLSRSAGWVATMKSRLVGVKFDTASTDLSVATAKRNAFNAARRDDYPAAIEDLQPVVNGETDTTLRSCLMSDLASYLHRVDAAAAQEMLKSASKLNVRLLRPLAGIVYRKAVPAAGDQSVESLKYLKANFPHANNLIRECNSIADDLAFQPNSYKRFHSAMVRVASLLGFHGDLPEEKCGRGPDVLWAVGERRYFVIECKNEATTGKVNKHDCNQLAGSMNWFRSEFDQTCSGVPVMVHPSSRFEYAATPPQDTVVMTREGLARFRAAFTAYTRSVSRIYLLEGPQEVATLLQAHKLRPGDLLQAFTEAARAS
jgi:hypothetical protein